MWSTNQTLHTGELYRQCHTIWIFLTQTCTCAHTEPQTHADAGLDAVHLEQLEVKYVLLAGLTDVVINCWLTAGIEHHCKLN